jgi:hypothetical protein
MGMSEYRVTEILLRLTPEIAREMAAGECVTLEGFGRFGAGVLPPAHGHPEMVYPIFRPNRALQNEVQKVCMVERARTSNHQLESYRHANRSRQRTAACRTFTASNGALQTLDARERRDSGRARR